MGGARALEGRRVALITKHGKEKVIRPVLEDATGCRVLVVCTYDTDRFGTFTAQVPRPGSQLETARLKARTAMELLGTDLGLASEGAFGPHPHFPFVPWNREVVLLLDAIAGAEHYGEHSSAATNFGQADVKDLAEAQAFARLSGFPEHFLVASPRGGQAELVKGINSWEHLAEAVAWCIGRSPDRVAVLETDMRAFANPTRMTAIHKAASDLASKLRRLCPRCGMMGFSVVEHRRGLRCEWCDQPTEEVEAEVYRCQGCSYLEEKPGDRSRADPGQCSRCNP